MSAYVVDGVRQEHVKPILDMAVSRFNAFSRMAREVEEDPQQAREPQGDRPRGLLMKSRRLSEDTAYALLRKSVTNQNRTISDIERSKGIRDRSLPDANGTRYAAGHAMARQA